MNSIFWISLSLCLLTYAGLAWGRWPRLKLDRAGISLVGATLLVVLGTVSYDEAARAVDTRTLVLLFGMMIIVAFLRASGFFDQVIHWTLERIDRPLPVLALTIALSGVLSAFLVNDVICIAFTPLILRIAARLKLNPIPYLLALATAANIGSSGTIIGNPQNMIIGSLSQIPYARFAARLMPPAMIGLVLDFLLIAFLYRGNWYDTHPLFVAEESQSFRLHRSPKHRRMMWTTLAVTMMAISLLFAGFPIALVALGGAAVLMLMLGRIRPEKIYAEVDWGLLVMFVGLFVIVHAFEINVLKFWNAASLSERLTQSPVVFLSTVSAALSNLVSNVPAVLLFKPILPLMPESIRENSWLVLAMSSTFAGNLTILGSVANLIVVESARRRGVEVSFREYCRVGIPITLITIAVGCAWLAWVRY